MNRIALLLFLASSCATLPPAPDHPSVPPVVTGPDLEICWIDTGGVNVPGGYGAGGSVTAPTWEVTAAALLVRHPDGDLLIDTGLSPTAQQDAEALHGWRRFVFNQTAGQNKPRRSVPEALKALGVTKLKAVVLSHAHADHAGGLTALPDVPVWVAAAEKEFIETNEKIVVMPAHAEAMKGRLVPIAFEEKPYANSDRSFDVFGDGRVVIVPTPGHTPGSVATFIAVRPDKRLVHVGDLINLTESIERKVGKSWLMRMLTDEDDAATARQVAKLVQLHEQDPSLVILPAHDRPAFVSLFGEDGNGPPPCLR